MKRIVWLFLLCSCAHKQDAAQDPYLWLENIEGKDALAWVETQNKESTQVLAQSPRYKKMEADALKILQAKDKIPGVGFLGKDLMNVWKDGTHERGLIRKTTLAEYKKANPKWETILDLDALAKKEKENWIFGGFRCLPPENQHCVLEVSRGGKDAHVVREFDMKTKKFVENGFNLPEAKTSWAWVDKDHILVGTDYGPDSMTESGYPRFLKYWTRGTPLSAAKLVFEAGKKEMVVYPIQITHGARTINIISKAIDFFNSEEYIFDVKKQEKKFFPKPPAADMSGYFEGLLLYKLRHPWAFNGVHYTAGSLVSISEEAAGRELRPADVQLIYTPKENHSFEGVASLKTKIVVGIIEDVKPLGFSYSLEKGKWTEPKKLLVPNEGSVNMTTHTDLADMFLYLYENYNRASSLYLYDFNKKPQKPQLLKSLPDRFNAKDVVVEQKFATSKDGTRIPYSLIYKKGTVFNGTAPTLQTGYGGFEISLTPSYTPLFGKLWIENGGVYVVANIRGGGEYGPRWHDAALKENRQKAYDDFIAVSEALIETKVTSTPHLAIRGRSNGGLLMGAMLTQRPDLYGAIICGVPLLDMMRYSQLLAGASWMGEYGDPNDAKYRDVILKYSPYQNVSADKKYPIVYFFTSTKDDRVHPGHARKMAAKMKDQKHQLLYYENTEGGHAGSSNFKQLAMMTALEMEFLYQTVAR